MPKKRATRGDTGRTKPKQLRKRLHKAEGQLQAAEAKRDRAQARVDALSIIADEIRSQLAEVEGAVQADPADHADGAERGAEAEGAAETDREAVSRKPRSKQKAKPEADPVDSQPDPEVASEAGPITTDPSA